MAVSTGSESEVLAGDLNGDGKINSTDISLMKRYLLKQIVDLPVEDDIKAADINKDGKVNSTDMSILKRVILRNYPLKLKLQVQYEKIYNEVIKIISKA